MSEEKDHCEITRFEIIVKTIAKLLEKNRILDYGVAIALVCSSFGFAVFSLIYALKYFNAN